MTSHEAFKVGFLLRCADEGMTPEETHLRVKQAVAVVRARRQEQIKQAQADATPWGTAVNAVTGTFGAAGTGLSNLAGLLWPAVPIAAVAGAAGLGYLGGRTTAEMGKDPAAVSEASADELLSEYNRLTERAKRLKQLRQMQNSTHGV